MRLGFFVNDVMTELAAYTTTRLALTATNRGDEVWYFSAPDFTYDVDEKIHAHGTSVAKKKYSSQSAYLADLQSPRAVRQTVVIDDFDVLMLRSDPSTDTGLRAWAQTAGITFGRAAMRRGVVVLNDPEGLLKAMNKMYFQLFPEQVRAAFEIAVYLVRGDVQKAKVVRPAGMFPDFLTDRQQPAGAVHVGFDKSLGFMDGAVHMGFGGQMDYAGNIFLLKEVQQKLFIQDAAVNETVALPIAFAQIGEIGGVAGVGQGVQHGHPVSGVALHPVVDEIGADEAGPARHQEGLGLVGHAASFARRSSMSSRPVCQAFG